MLPALAHDRTLTFLFLTHKSCWIIPILIALESLNNSHVSAHQIFTFIQHITRLLTFLFLTTPLSRVTSILTAVLVHFYVRIVRNGLLVISLAYITVVILFCLLPLFFSSLFLPWNFLSCYCSTASSSAVLTSFLLYFSSFLLLFYSFFR